MQANDLIPRRDARLPRWWWLSMPLCYALVAVLLGKNLGWDLLNYHWYAPYALLADRIGVDLAVAHQATYHNPLIDVPFYWLSTRAPAWLVGASLGACYGIVVALLGGIAHAVLLPSAFRAPLAMILAMILAMAGSLGGGALPAIGNVANDVPVVMGVLAALYGLLTRMQWREQFMPRQMLWWGVLAGLSAGLKLTSMIYVAALWGAVGLFTQGWRLRAGNALLLATGIGLGTLLTGGYWMWRMWQFAGNPLFPYFNHWWPSPLLSPGDYGDQTYPVPTGWMGWFYPVYFALNSYHVAEWSFHDAHLAAAYLLLPISMLWGYWRPAAAPMVRAMAARLVGVVALLAYLAWLFRFGVYRYLLPLEMWSPLLLMITVAQWPGTQRIRLIVLGVVLVLLQSLVRFELQRQPWDESYIRVQVPPLPDADHTMVLMAGDAPMAYVIPAFPQQIAFLRIDGWLVWRDDQVSGMARQMRARVSAHQGPLYLLFSPLETPRAELAAAAYGLQLSGQCRQVHSTVDQPLQLCELQRSMLN